MRLGGAVFYNGNDPEEIEAFKAAMKKHDIRIAEVGVWCNPLDPKH